MAYAHRIVKTVDREVLDRLGFHERFECWNRGEFDSMQDMYTEDAVLDVSAVFTDTAPTRGHEEMRSFWHGLRETWAGLRVDPVEVFDVGDGRYVVDLRLWGKGRHSGLEVEQRFAFLYHLRPHDVKVTSAKLYPDLASAVSAAQSSASRTA